MENSSHGWIYLHRKIQQKGWACHPDYFSLFVHILLMANHSSREWLWKGEIYRCEPGQFVTSRKKLASISGISESKVERILKTFESEQQIEQQTTSKNRLITVTNWSQYQKSEQQVDSKWTASEQQVDSKWTASEQQVNTNNKLNKLNKLNNVINTHGQMTKTDFMVFWDSYPNRVNKTKAQELFYQLNSNLLPTILEAVEKQKQTRQWKEGFVPHPTNWINDQRWNDEVITEQEERYNNSDILIYNPNTNVC